MNDAGKIGSHTPGPWTILYEGSIYAMAEQNGAQFDALVCHLPWSSFREFEVSPENKANARLIAAAPDLLDALKSAERWLSGMHSETEEGVETELREVHSAAWEQIDKFRAAILKAEGR
jgi:hypothetical protein